MSSAGEGETVEDREGKRVGEATAAVESRRAVVVACVVAMSAMEGASHFIAGRSGWEEEKRLN
jgi:hypothetical protein